MPTLTEAVLAREVVLKDGVSTLKDSIIDREEFVRPVPSEFSVVLGFIVRGRPDEKFSVSTDVLSHMSKPIWSASDTLEIDPAGRLRLTPRSRSQFWTSGRATYCSKSTTSKCGGSESFLLVREPRAAGALNAPH